MPRRILNRLQIFLSGFRAALPPQIRSVRLRWRRPQPGLPLFVLFPLFAARQLDASKITELLLWIFAFVAYVVLGVVILMRISRSIKGERSRDSYGGDAELFRELYRKKLISDKEYKTIQTRLRDQLVKEVLSSPAADPRQKNRFVPSEPDETEKLLRLQALLRETPSHRR